MRSRRIWPEVEGTCAAYYYDVPATVVWSTRGLRFPEDPLAMPRVIADGGTITARTFWGGAAVAVPGYAPRDVIEALATAVAAVDAARVTAATWTSGS
jgi:hypothetical protein